MRMSIYELPAHKRIVSHYPCVCPNSMINFVLNIIHYPLPGNFIYELPADKRIVSHYPSACPNSMNI